MQLWGDQVMPKATPQAKKTALAKEWIAFRQENLMTQQDLGDSLGISRRSVIFIEGGKKFPGPETRGMMRALMARVGKKE